MFFAFYSYQSFVDKIILPFISVFKLFTDEKFDVVVINFSFVCEGIKFTLFEFFTMDNFPESPILSGAESN